MAGALFLFDMMKKIFVLAFLVFGQAVSVSLHAVAGGRTDKDSVSYEQMGGIYYAYHYDSTAVRTPVPEGYTPFYISHFGRHGSRWLPSDSRYQAVLEQFADTTNLTVTGRDVRTRLLKIWADAEGRGGDLTGLGAMQQASLASRMYHSYPEVFHKDAVVSARSSIVGRCMMSMTAYLLKLQSLEPTLKITAEANRRFMPYIAYSSPEEDSLIASTPRIIEVSPERLIASLFRNPDKVKNKMDLLSELHCIASDMQNVDIGVSLYDIFIPEEMAAVYHASNRNMWICNSRNVISGDIPVRSAVSLWKNIVASADSAIACGYPQATLRFGHDTSLYRLLTLLGVYHEECRMDKIIPMGANLQIIFYRNSQGNILVKFLHNEHELLLPLESDEAPYYDWDDVKSFYSAYE